MVGNGQSLDDKGPFLPSNMSCGNLTRPRFGREEKKNNFATATNVTLLEVFGA